MFGLPIPSQILLPAATALAFLAWNSFVENPDIERKAVAVAVAAAAEAKAAEQLRQFEIGEWAANEFVLEQREDAVWQAAREELTRKEIAEYEQLLAAAASKCGLTQRDLDFVVGVRAQPTGPAARRRGPGEG